MNLHIENPSRRHICATCGTRYAEDRFDPDHCLVCLDDRQYIGEGGQSWTSHDELAKTRTIRFARLQEGLLDLRIAPAFAIGQRAHLVLSPAGNILWDCLPFLDAPTVAYLHSLGGLRAVTISHPHYYGLMTEWARAFDCPVYLHQNDAQWVMDPDPRITFWEGKGKTLWDGIRMVHTAGHFPGSTVLHLPHHGPRGTLLTGDSIFVSRDRKQVGAMYSYPNYIPLGAAAIKYLAEQVRPLAFDSLHGAFDGQDLPSGAYDIFARSMDKYLQIVSDPLK
ncbi:MBL fold metallo-hydrolase [Paraflavisolibacter sp. H34]|uniref:MBL fold metallo-hydrolase n=1 Tax=Huijunlia imazamoxiresistens TaxID=3127457 RepID=UPI00301A5710